MKTSFKGCGFITYGQADRRPDGTFITTLWFCVFYFPMVPLETMRILPSARAAAPTGALVYSGYSVIETLPRSWLQIIKTYAFCLACLAWWYFSLRFIFAVVARSLETEFHLWLMVLAVTASGALPFGLLWLMRREAFRARHPVDR